MSNEHTHIIISSITIINIIVVVIIVRARQVVDLTFRAWLTSLSMFPSP